MKKQLLYIGVLIFIACNQDEPQKNDQNLSPVYTLDSFELESLSGESNFIYSDLTELNGTLVLIKDGIELLFSRDEGNTWQSKMILNDGAIMAKGKDRLFCLGMNDNLYFSDDGSTWNVLPKNGLLPFDKGYNTVEIAAAGNMLSICFFDAADSKNDLIFVSDNNGDSFIEKTLNTSVKELDLGVQENEKIWIFRNDSILISTNKALSWSYVSEGFKDIKSMTVLNEVAAIETYSGVYLSNNSGEKWYSQEKSLVPKGYYFDGKLLATKKEGVGDYHAYKSIDGGFTWIDAGNCSEEAIGIVSTSNKTFILGANGLSFFGDKDAYWNLFNLPKKRFVDVEFFEDKMYVVSEDKHIYMSVNNGTTWSMRQFMEFTPTGASVHPDGFLQVMFKAENQDFPQVNFYDSEVIRLVRTSAFGLTDFRCEELVWLSNGVAAAIFNPLSGNSKLFASSNNNMESWVAAPNYKLEDGLFADLVGNSKKAFILVESISNENIQLVTTEIKNDDVENYWDIELYENQMPDVISIATPQVESDFVLALSDNNELSIPNNSGFNQALVLQHDNEKAEKIRFSPNNNLFVLTNLGIYRSSSSLNYSIE